MQAYRHDHKLGVVGEKQESDGNMFASKDMKPCSKTTSALLPDHESHKSDNINDPSSAYVQSVFDEEGQFRRLAVDDLGKRLHKLELNCSNKSNITSCTSNELKNLTNQNYQSNCSEIMIPTPSPLETEEWLAFLQQSMEEVMEGDLEAIGQKSFIAMVTKALISHGASCRVTEYIASLLSLPFVCDAVSQPELTQIRQVSSLIIFQNFLVIVIYFLYVYCIYFSFF